MSENTKDKKVVVVANLKSPVVGFVLALFLGWLGVDRFYKGGILSIVFGIIKLIFGVILFFGLAIFSILASADSYMGYIIRCLIGGYALWYVLDLIFVPLGISLDNRKKIARTQGGNQGQINTKKSKVLNVFNIAIKVVLVIVILILVAFIALTFLF